MINPPPKTGDVALDGFLRSVYEQSKELEAKALPEDGWSLTDFTAEVSGVIGDKRDLIDIVTQYDSIEDYLALVDDQKQLLEDALTKVESIEVSANWFAQIMEWWDQNYKIIQDAQESLTYKREADAAALEAKGYAEKTGQDRLATGENLTDAREAASDAADYRQSSLTYRDSSKRYSEASDAAKALSEAAQALAEQFRDGAKIHREATKVSETNAEASASAASTDANKSAGSASEAAGEVTKAEAAREQVEAVEAALRALMADTEAWQDVSFALESVDNRISTGMETVKNDILGGVGPAFDTLLELAEALGENADAIGTLTNELAKKADKGHTHTSADITDAYYFTGGTMKDRVVKTYTDGHIFSASDPGREEHLARKAYVDAEVAKKANTSHTHTISETSGLQTALDGKAPESHIHSIGEVDGLEAQLAARAAEGHSHTSADITDAVDHIHGERAGRLVEVGEHGHIRDGNPPTNQYDLSNKGYVDGEVAKKADDGHKHVSEDITDATSAATADRVVKRNSAGDFSVNEPAYDSYPANKGYVDSELDKKADTGHKHAISDVNGLQSAIDDAAGAATWSELAGKPSTFPPSTHSHSWSQVTGKPSTFAPSSHSHSISDVTGLEAALNAKANSSHSHSWGQVTGKPSTFAPSTHSHSWSEITGKPSTGFSLGTSTYSGDILKVHTDGWLYLNANPTLATHPARKEYVDDRTPPIKVVDSLPSNPAADTLYFVKE